MCSCVLNRTTRTVPNDCAAAAEKEGSWSNPRCVAIAGSLLAPHAASTGKAATEMATIEAARKTVSIVAPDDQRGSSHILQSSKALVNTKRLASVNLSEEKRHGGYHAHINRRTRPRSR